MNSKSNLVRNCNKQELDHLGAAAAAAAAADSICAIFLIRALQCISLSKSRMPLANIITHILRWQSSSASGYVA
jgi:hypothetical protein